MIKPTYSVNDVKKKIISFCGSRVNVKVDLGRNRTIKYTGTLSGVYPALFTVEPDDKTYLGKTSYSYAEVLCGNVKLKRLSL